MPVTPIEWVRNTDGSQGRTINPLRARDKKTGAVGHFCEPVSLGCGECYASRMQGRFRMHEFAPKNRDKVELFLDRAKLDEVVRRTVPTSYFWEDMSDLFYEGYNFMWLDMCFAAMVATPWHRHYVLTKRIKRALAYFEKHTPAGERIYAAANRHFHNPEGCIAVGDRAWPIPNVRFGVSAENQATADERVPGLRRIPAAWRYVSYEPALGPVTWIRAACTCVDKDASFRMKSHEQQTCPVPEIDAGPIVDAIIIGGESAARRKVRPFYLGRARSTIRQCHDRGTAVFMKQMGTFPTMTPIDSEKFKANPVRVERLLLTSRKGSDPAEWPEEYRVREGF